MSGLTPPAAFAASSARTAALVIRRRLKRPDDHLGWRLSFGDGSTARVYRETVNTTPSRTRAGEGEPALLVVAFKLRLLGRRPWLHTLFRRESWLNTPLFAGFPGFRSKLWLTDAGTAVYRGVYEWDGAGPATSYATTLCVLLRLLSEPGTVRFHVQSDTTPAAALAAARAPVTGAAVPVDEPAEAEEGWWRIVAVEPAVR